MKLIKLRYECRGCSDVIESTGTLACCRCGAICIDALLDGGPGSSILRWRQLGAAENFLSRCVWETDDGERVEDVPRLGH